MCWCNIPAMPFLDKDEHINSTSFYLLLCGMPGPHRYLSSSISLTAYALDFSITGAMAALPGNLHASEQVPRLRVLEVSQIPSWVLSHYIARAIFCSFSISFLALPHGKTS